MTKRYGAGGLGTRERSATGRRNCRTGFTVLELLVVIAMITILAGLLLPVLARVREEARRAVCFSQIRQLGCGHQLYLQDWDERLPDWSLPGPPYPEPSSSARFWTEYLKPYLRGEALFRDPSAVWTGTPATDFAVLADYALLTWAQAGRRGDPYEPKMRFPGPPLALAEVVRPAETISLIDGWSTTRYAVGAVRRHGGGMNAGFLDGHVRWLSEKAFWRVDGPDEQGYYWLHYGSAHR